MRSSQLTGIPNPVAVLVDMGEVGVTEDGLTVDVADRMVGVGVASGVRVVGATSEAVGSARVYVGRGAVLEDELVCVNRLKTHAMLSRRMHIGIRKKSIFFIDGSPVFIRGWDFIRKADSCPRMKSSLLIIVPGIRLQGEVLQDLGWDRLLQ